MNQKELSIILDKHKRWIDTNQKEGERANLRGANLSRADLSGANLRSANLSRADLRNADLSSADLSSANLSGADLSSANLRSADLSRANLRNANLDFSCWPLWCGSLGVKIDKRLFCQLAYHLCRANVDDEECNAAQEALYPLANQFHRVEECGRLGDKKKHTAGDANETQTG